MPHRDSEAAGNLSMIYGDIQASINRLKALTMSLFFNTRYSFSTDLLDAVCRLFGYECNLHREADPYAEVRPSGRTGFFAFERRIINEVSSEYWGLGCYVLVSNIRLHERKLAAAKVIT